MKTVLTNNELPHKWAHQTQPSGRNGKSSMSFTGRSFYSYNAEIGRVIRRNNKVAYLVNVTNYSVTTTQHQSWMRRAIPSDAIVFRIGDMGRSSMPEDHKLGSFLFNYAIEQAAESLAKETRARAEWKKNSLAADQSKWLCDAKAISEFFGLRRKVDDKAIERHKERIIADEKRRAKEQRELQERREKENAERIQQWLAGDPVMFPYSVQRVYLRRKPDTDPGEMQTSKGATIPLADAERAFRFAIARKEKGWRRNGEECKVGDYQLDSVGPEGLIAGCHRIDWGIIESFAKQQGWI